MRLYPTGWRKKVQQNIFGNHQGNCWYPNTTSASTIETHHIAIDRRRLEVVMVDVYIINDARVHCLLNAACDKYKINGKPIIVSIQSMPCLQVRFYNTGAYSSWNIQVPFALKLYSINPNQYFVLPMEERPVRESIRLSVHAVVHHTYEFCDLPHKSLKVMTLCSVYTFAKV